MSKYDLQPCDDRRYIQKLIALLIQEYSKLQDGVCREVSNRAGEFLNTDKPINICQIVTPAILNEITAGNTQGAVDRIATGIGLPPSSRLLFTQGFENLTLSQKQEIQRFLVTQGIRVVGTEIAQEVQAYITAKVKCPTPERAAKIISNTNKVKKSVLKLQKTLEGLNNALNIAYSVTRTLSGIITTAEVTVNGLDLALPALAATPTGASGLSARIMSKVENLIRPYKQDIAELEKDICEASKVVVYIATQVNLLIAFLEVLDLLLQRCIAQATELEQLQGINLATYNELGPQVRLSYRGYTIDIRTDENSPAIAPRRYAVALDPVGVVVLTGPSSFSSNTDILIEELKFRIDNHLG